MNPRSSPLAPYKHGDMRWTWAILLLAGGRAERRVVVEDFSKAGLWTDTGQVLRTRLKRLDGREERPDLSGRNAAVPDA